MQVCNAYRTNYLAATHIDKYTPLESKMEDRVKHEDSKDSESGLDVNKTLRHTGKPLMLWKLGSEGRGWIPSKKHFESARDFIRDSRLDERYDVYICHFGVHVEIVHDPRPWWSKLLGR